MADSSGFQPPNAPIELPGGWKLFERIGEGPSHRAMRAADAFTEVASVTFLASRIAPPKLDHPNIARLLDSGYTADGVPFVAMELVDQGLPIVEFCRTLPLRERLRVFLKVCGAVDHAHRHLAAHGDIKPANILVTPQGEPKLLDFGIPRRAVDTSADIDSLGALLLEIARGVAVPADLQAIARKANDPARRYSSVERLIAETQRHLDGFPVLAHEGGWRYRASKWISRNKLGAAAAAALAVCAAAFIWQAAQTARERQRAEEQLRETREIAGMMAMLVPRQLAAVSGSLPLRRRMVRFGLSHLDQLLAERDPADRKQRRQLALGYFEVANALGATADYGGASDCYRKAIDLLWEDSASLRRDAAVLAAMRDSHGRLLGDLRRLRRLPEALRAAEDCIVKAPAIDSDSSSAVALGCRFQRLQILAAMGQPLRESEAEAVLSETLRHAEFAVGAVNAELLLARLYLDRGDFAQAIAHAKLGLDAAPRNRDPEVSVLKARIMAVASLAEFRSGERDAGRQRFDECFDLLRELVRRESSEVEPRAELARALFDSLETIPDDAGLHHARMVEAESLAQSVVKDIDYPEGRFLLVRILGRQAQLQNNDCGLRRRALDEYQKLVAAGLSLPGDKPAVDEIRDRKCEGTP